MLLTTTGARTGQAGEAIVTYTRDGDRYVIAASKSGAPDSPAWYSNVVAHPDVEVEVGGEPGHPGDHAGAATGEAPR
jgi:deazaflavin-dependent oxidoreductase (nitroreductase family)